MKRKGQPRSVYTPKSGPPRTVLLTALAQRALDAAAERAGDSVSNVVEHLVRVHGPAVTAEAFVAREATGIAG